MGTCLSIACAALDRMMTPWKDGEQRRLPSTSREVHTFPIPAGSSDRPEYRQVKHSYDDMNDCVILDSPSSWQDAHTTKGNTGKQKKICTGHLHNCRLEKSLEERSDVLHCQIGDLQKFLTKSQTELEASQRKVQKLQHDVSAKEVLIEKMCVTKAELEEKLRYSQDASDSSAREVQGLKADVQGKENVLVDLKTERCQLMTRCQKLEAQLATIEQKIAQESLTSGSYDDDHANPGMLEVACKAVDKATESLAKFLHDNSTTKSCPLDSQHLENLVCHISPGHPAEFSRVIQVKYAWGHWICLIMFRCFEHVYFDVDDIGMYSSPLDSKKYALLCFQRFQHVRGISASDLYRECHFFQAFCTKKQGNMFPPWLLQLAFHIPKPPEDIVFGDFQEFNGHEETWNRFLEVAKAVWLLHHLSFSFNPPATILRMAKGIPYDKQFHDSVIHDENSEGVAQMVMLMTRPAFRLRNSVIRSRVFLSKQL